MTVIRGDAARSLVARTGSVRRRQRRPDGISHWSHSIDKGRANDAGAVLGGTERPPHPWTATPAPSGAGTCRPDQTGCVEWVLARSRREITTCAGMPPAMVGELAALLEPWHGSDSPGLAQSAATAVAELITAGGPGSLRLSGTRSHLLVEVTGVGPQPPTRTDPAPDARTGPADNRGSYRTFAETGSKYVRWVRISLPARRHETDTTAIGAAQDVWT